VRTNIVLMNNAATAADPQRVIADTLQNLAAFRELSREDLLVLGSRAETITLKKGQSLFKHGESDPWMYVLLSGEIELTAKDGRTHRIADDSPKAGQIISRLKPRLHTCTALTPCNIVRIDGDGVGFWHSAVDPSTMLVEELADNDCLAGDDRNGAKVDADFELPSMPDIAVKARELIDRDDCDAETVARLLMNDPSMTAKLIRAANSPVFYSTQGVSTCDQAIVRLGLKTTRYLITAFAVRALFNFDAPALDGIVRELWDHSTEVAAIASVLARHTRRFDPGEAQLAGLLHDVGVIPVLSAAAGNSELADDPESVVAMASQQRSAMGKELLKSWYFPAPLVAAAAEAEDWHRNPGEKADLADLVVVAQLLSFIGKNQIVRVPAVVSVPAFRKLLGDDSEPAQVLEFLKEAQGQIDEIRSLLRT
jgi:HD-like signal output (HDOD) protein